MIYRFTIISDEVDDFVREIQIDPEATFLDFHEAIVKATGFKKGELASFFICDDGWNKETEITLEPMDTSSDVDSWTMEETTIEELVKEEKQKLLYLFDYIADRYFFIKLSEIITGKYLTGYSITRSQGEAPVQTLTFEELDKTVAKKAEDFDTDFFGGEDFDTDELDREGFEGLEGLDSLDTDEIY